MPATETKTRAGFQVPCPRCGALDGLTVAVCDLTLSCRECSEDVTAQEIRDLIADACRLLRWLDAAETIV